MSTFIIIFIPYILAINLFSFILFYVDKKRAINRKQRISEASLFLVSFLFGALGSILGMNVFSHKTKKARFQIGLPLLLIVNFVITYYLFMGVNF